MDTAVGIWRYSLHYTGLYQRRSGVSAVVYTIEIGFHRIGAAQGAKGLRRGDQATSSNLCYDVMSALEAAEEEEYDVRVYHI